MEKEGTLLRHALISEECVTKEELNQIERMKKEMEKGKRKKLNDALSGA